MLEQNPSTFVEGSSVFTEVSNWNISNMGLLVNHEFGADVNKVMVIAKYNKEI